jgi:hypothetical protein
MDPPVQTSHNFHKKNPNQFLNNHNRSYPNQHSQSYVNYNTNIPINQIRMPQNPHNYSDFISGDKFNLSLLYYLLFSFQFNDLILNFS